MFRCLEGERGGAGEDVAVPRSAAGNAVRKRDGSLAFMES